MRTKACKVCGSEYPIEEFPIYGRLNTCKTCYLANNREKYAKDPTKAKLKAQKWRSENKDKLKETMKKYYRNNKDSIYEQVKKYRTTPEGKITTDRFSHNYRCRNKKVPCTLTAYQWDAILKNQNNKCAMCGKRFCKSRPPTKDHIIPVSKGGGLTFENVQALCQSCNSSKRDNIDKTLIISW